MGLQVFNSEIGYISYQSFVSRLGAFPYYVSTRTLDKDTIAHTNSRMHSRNYHHQIKQSLDLDDLSTIPEHALHWLNHDKYIMFDL